MRLSRNVARWLLPLSMVLVGCSETTSSPPMSVGEYRTHAPLADTTNIVFVLPIDGVRGPAKLILADAIAASLRDAARPAVISQKPNTQGPTIAGRISEIRKRGSVSWVTADWQIRAPYGETVARTSHEVVVDNLLWKEAGVEAVNLIVAEAEPYVVGMVSDHVGPLTATQDVAMPPSERISTPSGSSQFVEVMPPSETEMPDMAAEPVSPVAVEEPGMLNMPEQISEEPSSPLVDTLTPEDVAVSPTQPKAPVRLLPRGMKQSDEEAEAEDISEMPGLDSMMKDEVEPVSGELEEAEDEIAKVPDNTDLKPVAWGRPSFLVRVVTGAPGDGNEVLTSSIKKIMRSEDMTVTEDPRQAAYEVKGRVVVGPPVNGRQQARIVWRVNTIDGNEVGQAVQENAIIAGSLDGEWGRVADIVTNAAVNGIREMFDDTGRQRQVGSAKFADPPALPRVPGRAPPPGQ